MTIDTNSVPTQRASVDAAELEGGVKIWLTIQGETSHTTMVWRAPSWDALAETIDTTPSSEVAALLSRAEAAERERDEALAREAALREAVMGVETSTEALVRFAAGDVYDIIMDREGVQDRRKSEAFIDAIVRAANALEALTSTSTVAVARGDALVERVARGIHEAHKPWCDYTYPFEDPSSGQEVYMALARAAIRALMKPTDGMVEAADRAMYGRVVEGERRIPVIRDGLRAALTAALKETPDA